MCCNIKIISASQDKLSIMITVLKQTFDMLEAQHKCDTEASICVHCFNLLDDFIAKAILHYGYVYHF